VTAALANAAEEDGIDENAPRTEEEVEAAAARKMLAESSARAEAEQLAAINAAKAYAEKAAATHKAGVKARKTPGGRAAAAALAVTTTSTSSESKVAVAVAPSKKKVAASVAASQLAGLRADIARDNAATTEALTKAALAKAKRDKQRAERKREAAVAKLQAIQKECDEADNEFLKDQEMRNKKRSRAVISPTPSDSDDVIPCTTIPTHSRTSVGMRGCASGSSWHPHIRHICTS
jgi:fused signal recognition particle receptor